MKPRKINVPFGDETVVICDFMVCFRCSCVFNALLKAHLLWVWRKLWDLSREWLKNTTARPTRTVGVRISQLLIQHPIAEWRSNWLLEKFSVYDAQDMSWGISHFAWHIRFVQKKAVMYSDDKSACSSEALSVSLHSPTARVLKLFCSWRTVKQNLTIFRYRWYFLLLNKKAGIGKTFWQQGWDI
jgi:hypothetical protein